MNRVVALNDQLLAEWRQIREELWPFYTCPRCDRCVCDRVPIRVTPEDKARIRRKLALNEALSPLGGKFILPPCPFYESKTRDGLSGCLIHGERPQACRNFPFGELPLIRGVDFCPLAQEITSDLKKLGNEVEMGRVELEVNPLEEELRHLLKSGGASLSPEQAYEELKQRRRGDIPSMLGETMIVFHPPLRLFRTLLKLKRKS